ncbi:MAG: hypothetical protein STSR0003_03810 [Smithella sp.]
METNSCPHYRSETKVIISKTIRASREPIRPNIHLSEWCEHHNSPHRKGTIGQLTCHGEISHCPIPHQVEDP